MASRLAPTTPTCSAATASASRCAGTPGLPDRLQRRLDALAQALERLDAREVLVVGGDDVPRSRVGGGALDHVVHGARVIRPLLAVAPVLGGDLEALVGRFLARLEAAQLLARGDRKPELRDDGTGLDDLLLELVDLAIGAHPVELGSESLDTLDHHAPVPRPTEDHGAAVAPHVSPQTPQVGLPAC